VGGTISGYWDILQLPLCVGALEIGVGLVEDILVRARVDHEQDVTRLDQLPFLETDLVDVATDARPDFHAFDSLRAPGIFNPFHDFFTDGRGDGDGRGRDRRGLALPLGFTPTSRQGSEEGEGQMGQPAPQRL
jgi:hypothetical protein